MYDDASAPPQPEIDGVRVKVADLVGGVVLDHCHVVLVIGLHSECRGKHVRAADWGREHSVIIVVSVALIDLYRVKDNPLMVRAMFKVL